MIQTIRVNTTKGPDLLGQSILQEINQHTKSHAISSISTTKVYRLEGITEVEARVLADIALSESINQEYTINKPVTNKKFQAIEIAYKPGVMNPEAASLVKSARDLGIKPLAADSSHEFLLTGTIEKSAVHELFEKLKLFNPIVEHIVMKEPQTLQITGVLKKTKTIPIRNLSDKALLQLSKDTLFLNLEEMKVIQKYFKGLNREPTDCELEVLAQTWSEHCVHKTFRADVIIDGKKKKPFIKRIKETAKEDDKRIVSAFVDNSGVIDFYDEYGICGKVETHNSPSAIEPYGGAMTGSGGVIRDILGTGQGAKVLIATDIFCFAPPYLAKKDVPPGCLPPEYLLKKVVAGVRDYGNRVGIPTNNGSIHFHKDFRAKPTVAVGAYGILPKKQAVKKSPKKDDLILTLGGRTGRDGIHGATFSSGEMTERTTDVSGSAVQIGNAIEEKRVIDAIQKLRDQNLIRAITDCGAGGYSSAIGEMGQDLGAKVFLENVPLKYPSLTPWEIFLSESQERMVIAIDPDHLKEVVQICTLYNVETAVIGAIDGNQRLQVFYKQELVCDIDMEFLHNGLPKRNMIGISKQIRLKEILPVRDTNFEKAWLKIMGHGNICSKEPIVRMYDHTVQGRTVLHPFGGIMQDSPNDGSIVKPFYNKPYGLVTAHGLHPELNAFDPYWGSIWAITEAVSNYVAIGGDLNHAALIDNFIWPFPDEKSLADLDKAVDACVKMATLLHLPFVSGKDSLSSTYRYPSGDVLKIPPVLLISVFGKIPDVTKTVTSDLKKPASSLVLVGNPDTANLAGSAYFDVTQSQSKSVPKVDLPTLPKVLQRITSAVQNDMLLSCHDISEGGLAASIAEMCIGGGIGATIDIKKIAKGRADFIFFSETAGTFLVEVEDEKTAKKLFSGIPHIILGKTHIEPSLTILSGDERLANVKVSQLRTAWQKPMKEIFS